MKPLLPLLLALAACTTPSKSASEAQSPPAAAEPAIEVLRLQHAAAVELAGILRDQFRAGSAGTLRITADERTNSIVVQGTAEDLQRVRACVTELDRPATAR